MTQSSGPERIRDGVITLALACPDELIAGQILHVDLPRSQKRTVNDMRISLRRALKGADRKPFGDVRPCPDHRQHAAIVQVADMLAVKSTRIPGSLGRFFQAWGNKSASSSARKTPPLAEFQ